VSAETVVAYEDSFRSSSAVREYADGFGGGMFMSALWDLEKEALARSQVLARANGKGSYLDFACGHGRVSGLLAPRFTSAIGVDISEAMVALAREVHPTLTFVSGDITASPSVLDGRSAFDVISVFRFLPQAAPNVRLNVLRKLVEHLAPEGILVINNNANRTSALWPALVTRSVVRRESVRQLLNRRTLAHRHLERLLADLGLEVVEVEPASYLPETIARRLPRRAWLALERRLIRAGIGASFATDQVVIARRISAS